MQKAPDVSAELSLPSIDVSLSYKGDHIQEVASPWSKQREKVFKYKVYVSVLGKGKTAFDFYGSINDCNATNRELIEWFKNLSKKEISRIDRFIRHHEYPNIDLYLSYPGWSWELSSKAGINPENNDQTERRAMIADLKKEIKELLTSFIDHKKKFGKVIKDHLYSVSRIFAIQNGEYDDIGIPKYMDAQELLFAFRCFVQDAHSGTMDISDFQSDFGYTDAGECIRVHKACQIATKEFEQMGINADKLCDIMNELSEAGVE